MNQPSILATMSLLALAVLASGCAGDRAALRMAALDDTRQRANAVVQEVQAELAELRAEMAATRIAAAKKEAELQELRREVKRLRAAQAKFGQAQVQPRQARNAQQGEQNALPIEGDRSVEQGAVLEARLPVESAGPGITRLRAGETEPGRATVQARVKALEASVTALTTQLTELTQDRTGSDQRSPRRETDPDVRITVKRGDTLWEFAQTYGVTVSAIQAANGLTGDLILVGQRLLIPRAAAPIHRLSP